MRPEKKHIDIIKKEQRNAALFLSVFSVTSISGFITFLYPNHNIWQQIAILLHTVIGFLLCGLFVLFIINHILLTQGFRRPAQALIGWSSTLLLLFGGISGGIIGVIGQYESQRWIYDYHIITTSLSFFLIAIHLFLFRLLSQRNAFSNIINRQLAKTIVGSCAGFFLLLGILAALYSVRNIQYVDAKAAIPFTPTFGENHFLPSQAETDSGEFIDEKRVGRSEKCGTCHAQITKEWRESMHGSAASDMFFQKNLQSLIQKKGIASARYCGGCHIPVALLSGQLSEGGNTAEGHAINEGVSCMACHGLHQAVNLKGVGSYLFTPQQDYLFGDSDGAIQTQIHNYLMQISPRQHRNDMARDFLTQPESCATCHEQFIDKELNNWGWVKLQNQYQAWLEGPFSGHSDQNYANEKTQRCQDCHFPLVDNNTLDNEPSADQHGQYRSHRSPAANTAHPFVKGNQEQLDTTIRFMKDNRLVIKVQLDQSTVLTPGGNATFNVAVLSREIGHNFPAGTIDINQPWIELIARDNKNRVIYASGLIDDNNKVDPSARFFYSSLIDKKGKRVWKHDLFNAVGESYVNVISPGKADIHSYQFTIPESVSGSISVSARLRYRKFNQDYASWALSNRDIQLPVVDMANDSITLHIESP